MNKVTMYNPRSKVTVQTTEEYKHKWEDLGFVVLTNVYMLLMSA